MHDTHINDIKNINPIKLQEDLNPIINNLFKSFQFLDISKEKFTSLALFIIKNCQQTYDNTNEEFSLYFKKSFQKSLIIKVKEDLEQNEYEVINNYIKFHIPFSTNNNVALKNFQKLNAFFKICAYKPSLEFINSLVKENKSIEQMAKLSYEAYKDMLLCNDFSFAINSLHKLVMESYCLVNNISITNINLEENDFTNLKPINFLLKEAQKYPILTAEEEIELSKRIHNGDKEAKDIFIKRNIRLVIFIAKKFTNSGLDLEDLVEEGIIGLIKTIDKFDYTKGYKFSTYAMWGIKQAISRAISKQARTIRLPSYINDNIFKLKKTIDTLEKELKRTPTTEEISQRMNTKKETVENLLIYMNEPLSIYYKINENEDTELIDVLGDSSQDIENNYINNLLKEDLDKVLNNSKLSEKEKEILILRTGYNGENPKTLEEIGKLYNVTRERIRQIESHALKKIRRKKDTLQLLDYTSNPGASERNITYYKKNVNIYSTFIENLKDSFYDFFPSFSNDQVNLILSTLSDSEIEIIDIFYDCNLNLRDDINPDEIEKKWKRCFNKLIKNITITLMKTNSFETYEKTSNNDRTWINVPNSELRIKVNDKTEALKRLKTTHKN